MTFTLKQPKQKLLRILWIGSWFAAVGLFPLFYGPHDQLPEWQHTIDMIFHWAGLCAVFVSGLSLVFLAGVKIGLGQTRIDEMTITHWKEN